MASRDTRAVAEVSLPPHWRDVREWSMEKRQSYAMWVLNVESLLSSMARQLQDSLEKYPRQEHEDRFPSSLTKHRTSQHSALPKTYMARSLQQTRADPPATPHRRYS
ncbi:hypothetical protein HF521_000082 [Silurus meridionalis]|uniref:Uncharacterized protein n=1 Tax=Silurus meridionalis TaxID=175797 RepID=A0A8T0BUU1_SILME|nr:hypothetical protein HF521_000082 [Silurus meridionalis]